MKQSQSLALFNQHTVRRHWDEDKELWYFSVIDVIQILAETDRPRKYRNDLKTKLEVEGSQLSEKIGQLKLISSDRKLYLTGCANTETMFRIIQSIPSPQPTKII